MSFGLLNLGIQAAQANKTALSVVGQNISNVNTPGYNRQVANLSTLPDQRGVEVDSISRITDDFLTRQLWADTATFNSSDIFQSMASELDNLLASGSTSISTAMDDYFKALQNVVDDPTSLPNRELFVAEAEALARRFNELNTVVVRQNDRINQNLSSFSQQITNIGSNIADLNDKIRLETVAGKSANELKDQRDQMIVQLSELVDVRVVDQDSGEFSVFVANGQPLVVGITANAMVPVLGDPDSTKDGVALVIAGNEVEITSGIGGGQVGGLLQYRDKILDPARNELGRIAVAFAESMNQAHQQGADLDGNLGGLLFNDVNNSTSMSNRILSNKHNVSSLEQSYVKIVDVGNLKASDYQVHIGASNAVTIERLSDGQRFTLDDLTAVAASGSNPANPAEPLTEDGTYFFHPDSGTLHISLDGFTAEMNVAGRFVEGDRFLLQPTLNGAAEFGTVLTDGRQLAMASPVRVITSPDNTGTGVADVNITDISSPTFQATQGVLNPPIDIVFNSGSPTTFTVFDMSNSSAPVPLVFENTGPMVNQIFTAGEPIELDGYQITIRNQPVAGDRFSFSYNTDGVSDNRNALTMSGLQQADLLEGGSYQDIYGRLIERVGTETSVATVSREAAQSVLTSTQDSKASLSGVNLDEEAARLIQFQQAYQASAQLISTSQTLFDTLLSSVRV